MTVAQLIAEINAGIYTNNNQEITAAVLNPILQDMVNQINDLTGQLDDLNTTDQSDLVAAINELKTAIGNLTTTGAVMADGSVPFIAPQVMVTPTTDSHGINRGFLLNVLHEYTKAQGFGIVDKPYNAVQAWDLETEQVAKTDGITGDMLIADPTNIKPGFVYLYMVTQDAIGGHDITFGSKYKFDGLIETSPNGANLFFCVAETNNVIYVQNLLKYPTGGQVDSVAGTAGQIDVDDTDPVNPIVKLAQAAKDSLALADSAVQPAAIANFITEEDVKNTTRTYTKAQQITEVALTISSGLVAVDLGASNAFNLEHSANCIIQNPTGLLANSGSSWLIHVKVTGAGGFTMALDTDYVWADGGSAPTFPNVTGDMYTLYMTSSTFTGKTEVSLFNFQ